MNPPNLDNEPFWAEAHQCMIKYDVESAEKIYRNALQKFPNNPSILDALGGVLLQKGEFVVAKQVYNVSISLAPQQGSEKYFSLAQMEQGKDAITLYVKGLEILKAQFDQLPPDNPAVNTNNNTNNLDPHAPTLRGAVLRQIISGMCAIVEVYLTDECYAPEAESECERLLGEALALDPTNHEALQLCASLRVSQERPDEALQALQQAYQQWAGAEYEHMPNFESRVSAAKLFLELGQGEPALAILNGLLAEDDDISELWYLHGFALAEHEPAEALESLHKARALLEAIGTNDEQAQHLMAKIEQLGEAVQTAAQEKQQAEGMRSV